MVHCSKKIKSIILFLLYFSPLSAIEHVNVIGSIYRYHKTMVERVRDILHEGPNEKELRILALASTRRSKFFSKEEIACLEKFGLCNRNGNFFSRDFRKVVALSIRLKPKPHVIDILNEPKIRLKDGTDVYASLFQKVVLALGDFATKRELFFIREVFDYKSGQVDEFIIRNYSDLLFNGRLKKQVKLILDQALVLSENRYSIIDPTGRWDMIEDSMGYPSSKIKNIH